jgi:hypothetical protein
MLTGADAARVLAHPVRVRILGYLTERGSGTPKPSPRSWGRAWARSHTTYGSSPTPGRSGWRRRGKCGRHRAHVQADLQRVVHRRGRADREGGAHLDHPLHSGVPTRTGRFGERPVPVSGRDGEAVRDPLTIGRRAAIGTTGSRRGGALGVAHRRLGEGLTPPGPFGGDASTPAAPATASAAARLSWHLP